MKAKKKNPGRPKGKGFYVRRASALEILEEETENLEYEADKLIHDELIRFFHRAVSDHHRSEVLEAALGRIRARLREREG